MATRTNNKADRIFVRDGRRSYRRKYSVAETRAGIVIVVLLFAVVLWVAWKGARPDPSLFMLETDLSQAGLMGEAGAGAAGAVDRGPVPSGLARQGWYEGEITRFDYDNLFVKINGREGFYKSFGFEMLYFLSIVVTEDPGTVVDIELYDLGSAANAVGAYSGERSPGVSPVVGENGMKHIDRNALFLTQGRYYLRAIGSDESPDVLAELEHIQARFERDLPGEPLPWGYALFVGAMGLTPGAVSYATENAFSFGFASNVYSAKLESGAELFVTPAGDEAAAAELAGRYLDGFRRYGADEGAFIKDRYQGKYATAVGAGPWVVGFLRAPDPGKANDELHKLAAAVRNVPLPGMPGETPAEDNVADDIEDGYGSDEF